MNTALTVERSGGVLHFRRFFRTNPEWWTVAVAAAAWGAVITHAIAHQGHVYHVMSFGTELENWLVMSTAMMLPLMREPIRWVASRGFYTRRHRSIALFLIAFLGAWGVAGLLPAWLRSFDWAHEPGFSVASFCTAAVWTMTSHRDRALAYCHWTAPIAPSGREGDRDCLRFGACLGVACVITCWPLMLACTLTGHNIVAMVGGAILGGVERRSFRPATRSVLWGSLLLAAWFLLPISTMRLP
jgi:predicted metal-binding membrane protein